MSKAEATISTVQIPMRSLGLGAAMTLRGSSLGFGFNLGLHVGDEIEQVVQRRQALASALGKPIFWVDQTHSTTVLEVGFNVQSQIQAAHSGALPPDPSADALVTTQADCILAIMTADCLPVIFRSQNYACVGIAHAGWRGLLNGVLENTVHAMRKMVPQARVQAQFGVAIGPTAWEVGSDVVEAFAATDPATRRCFSLGRVPGKYWGNLYDLARIRLAGLDVAIVEEPSLCTFQDATSFFSYRRDGLAAGRQATLVWRP